LRDEALLQRIFDNPCLPASLDTESKCLKASVPGFGTVANACALTWQTRTIAMLGWALTFLIIALVAALLGFGGIAGFAVEIAKIIFYVAIILFLISAVFGLLRGRAPRVP
jgi:uncharacterized membrane protein YtjA (UPF0391 family)